jgi:hypothetical protein
VRIEPVGLRASSPAKKSTRLHRLGQPHLEPLRAEIARDPAPAGRRLDRDRRDPPTPTLRPPTQAVSIGGETLFTHLAALRIEHSRLKHMLVDVDRCVAHHGPPRR